MILRYFRNVILYFSNASIVDISRALKFFQVRQIFWKVASQSDIDLVKQWCIEPSCDNIVAVLPSQNKLNVSHPMLLEPNAGHPLVNAIHPPIPNSP